MEDIDTTRNNSTIESTASDNTDSASDTSQKKKLEPKIVLTPFQNTIKQIGGVAPMIEDIEISENLAEFYRIRKHYLILTDAGKPVYSRYGDEQILAPFFATMSAVIPKMQSYFWDGSVDAR
jgi:hypothetical protein